MSATYDDEWTYRGVRCVIETDWEDDRRWSYKRVMLPDTVEFVTLDISNYDHSRASVEAWIDRHIATEGIEQ